VKVFPAVRQTQLAFFTTVGLSADGRRLVTGGPKLVTFLAFSALFIAVQNFAGISAAWAMDLHPAVGLLGGSIALTGGHGTGAAYDGRFGDTMNLAGAVELTMACATAGLVGCSSMVDGLRFQLVSRDGELRPRTIENRAEHQTSQ
jgi:ESS family glutamate:Na+ symporter